MRATSIARLAVTAVLGASVLVVACTTSSPTVITQTSSPTLGPSTTAVLPSLPTLAPGQTIPFTLPPIATLPPAVVTQPPAVITQPPTVTNPPTPTEPPTPEPTPTEPPTPEPTPTLEHPDWPPGAIAAKDAADHVGETLTVCGKVNSANWLFSEPGHPTWLNLGPAYPNQRFNVLIWGEQRRAWSLNGKPEVIYINRVICVTGLIEAYQGWTQIQDVAKADIQVIP